jgi:2-oxoisovalerate dehydrogenase E1 component subunit beta
VTETNLVGAVRETLHAEMAADDRVLLLGQDVGARGGVFKVSDGFLEEFGEDRVIDAPLAESGIVGVAIGMALRGLRPVAEIEFADFIHPAFDQIVSEAARMRYRTNGDWGCPIVIRAPCGGGIHGALYHSQSIEAFYAHVPGLKVVMPSTPADAAGLLRSSIRDADPVLFLEHKKCYRAVSGDVPDGEHTEPIGMASVVRPGRDISVITYGYEVHRCIDAAERLEADHGVSAEVVDVRTLAPLDTETILSSVRETSRALVVYEDNRTYGAGAEIAATIAEEALFDLDAPVVRVGGPDIPAMPYAAPLEHFYVEPSPDHVYAAMLELART